MLTLEKNGDNFVEEKLLTGQRKLSDCIQQIAQQIGPGMTEKQGAAITQDILQSSGFGKNWHPPKIRFGSNTLKTFSEPSAPEIVLQENDIFFLDLGPIIADHECDFGQTFVLGNNPDLLRLRDASKNLFYLVQTKWSKEHLSGAALYEYAHSEAQKLGYSFVTRGASGHRIGDFPHHVHYRGNLMSITEPVQPRRWILEIQIHDQNLNRGAFFEDIL
ncbi:MAG: aminopeptidase P family protein [Bdellovibrionaceae bacterium]|nr:aminopeptidase P family protein [Pseudobdellovibrionaceae bacterium]